MPKMNSMEAAVRILESEGVKNIFGIPGAGILPFYRALMDDPDFTLGGPGSGDEGGQGGGPFGDLDVDDPAFQAAQEACSEILGGLDRVPGAGRPGGGG